jgi:phosphoenolpyruvate---glycerone phosphotransferase subunit DhaL
VNLTLLIQSTTQMLIDHVEELTTLDQAIGDGDHGLNMKRGALAIQARQAELATKTLPEALKLMGMTCMSTVGGSSGPVFGTLMVTMAKSLPGDRDASAAEVAAALGAGVEALKKLGKVEVGQKTLLDVLDPVQKELAAGGTDLAARVRDCAARSASATANTPATKGRSSFLGDRALGHVDPGSRSMSLIIATVCDHLEPRRHGDPP